MIGDYNPNSYGTHTVQVTIQKWDYRGHIAVKIGGNCKGLELLRDIDETIWEAALDHSSSIISDCGFEVIENGYGDEDFWYKAVLKNECGDTLLDEGDQNDFENAIVEVAIIAYEPEK